MPEAAARAALELQAIAGHEFPHCAWISKDGEWAAFSDGEVVPVVNWVSRRGEPLVPEVLNEISDKSEAFVCRHSRGWVLVSLIDMPEYLEH